MKSLLIVCQNYTPGAAATADLVYDLAEGLRRVGWDVTVFCRLAMPGPVSRTPSATEGRISILTSPRSPIGNSLRMSHLWNAIAVFGHLFKNASAYDAIITTDEPLGARLMVAIALKSLRSRVKQVAWVMDFSPGRRGLQKSSLVRRVLCKIADWLVVAGLRAADTTVAIGHDMAALFSGLGIKQNRIKVIAVWSSLWVPAPKTSGWKDDRGTRAYSVLYAGHLGPWHDYKTIESVIPNFASGGVLFRFAGVGSGIEHLKAEAAKTRAGNIAFEPRVVSTDIASLVALLSSADAHLITLHSSAIGTCVPSKLYAAMAVARPIIYVGPAESQASLDVQAAGAGFIVAPGDVGGLERAIRKLAADPQESRRLGLQGYQWFRKNRSLDVAIRVWDQLLCELAPSGKHQTAHDSSTLAVRS